MPAFSRASVSTVAAEIVERYREYGVDATVVTNAPPFRDRRPSAVHDPIRLVHSGNASPGRQLERTMRAVAQAASPVTLTLSMTSG